MKYKVKHYPDLEKIVETMSIDELLRSVICPDYDLKKNAPEGYEVTAFVHPTTEEIAKKEVLSINQGKERHTLIASDLEYGTGSMINGTVAFPSLMALSVCGDEGLAYTMGVESAQKARSVGYQWTFSPCVDILANPRSPIVNIRSSGEDADAVIRYSGAYMKGMIDGGLYVTLKHFPGDGYSNHDQHLCTTENPLSREEWDATVGKVYATLIEEGAQSIMPGHISLAAYDEIDEETGLYPPATMSKNLLTGLLREKLGFEGIIVSDATNMSGFCGYINLYRASARFLEAGGDCLLFIKATDEFFAEMRKQVEIGALRMETLRNRAYRMMCFTREYFETQTEPKVNDEALAACCEQITKGSVKVLRDRAGVLPLKVKNGTKIAHAVFCNFGLNQKADGAPAGLTRELEARGAVVDTFVDPGPGTLLRTVKGGEYDYLICSILNEVSYGLNSVKLCGPIARNMMGGWMRYGTPAIFVSYYDPYFADDYHSITDTVINTYGVGDFTAKTLADLLCQ